MHDTWPPVPGDDLDELLGAYALDAVEADERRRVEAYLAANPRARAEVDAHREVATLLAYTGAAAPPELWDRISDALDADDAPAPPVELVVRALPASLPSSPRSWRRRHRLGRSGVAALAAAAALVVGVAGGVLVADGRDGGAPSAEQAFRSAARAPGAHAMALASAEPGREAVPVVVLPDGTGYLQGDALAALPATDTYQLWAVTRAGSVVSVGVLGSRPRMQTFAVGEMPTALVITHERNPAGVERSAEPALYSATV